MAKANNWKSVKIKATKSKYFPNGFKSWQETHCEVVSEISHVLTLNEDQQPLYIKRIAETEGTGGIYNLAEELTDEFELKYKGKIWDGDYFDAIEEFLCDKSKQL
jgi:hypothetical protein